MCDCIKKVNAELAESQSPNTMIETPLFGTPRAFVVTTKRHAGLRGKKYAAMPMFATYCPFCGEKYPENAGTVSEILGDALNKTGA